MTTFSRPPRSDGTIQIARVKQPWPKDKLFKILSIDGGGIKGVFPTAYLADIERRYLNGDSVAGYFDMVAGTSTGGIIALGLANGLTSQQILNFYQNKGQTIFPTRSGFLGWRSISHWFYRKFDQKDLKISLQQVFEQSLINDARIRLVIPSFEGKHGEPFIFKTPHHPDYKLDKHKLMVDVALQTSAAPTYFQAVDDNGYIMLDGGLWANNPIMNALVDVLSCYDVPRENIRILSIGNGNKNFKMTKFATFGGLLIWAKRAFHAATIAQSKNALGQAYLLIGKHNVTRVDLAELESDIEMDDVRRALRELPSIAKAYAESSGPIIRDVFLNVRADDFIPSN